MPIVKKKQVESVKIWKASVRDSLRESFSLLSEEALARFIEIQEAAINESELEEFTVADAPYQQLRKNINIAPDPATKANLHAAARDHLVKIAKRGDVADTKPLRDRIARHDKVAQAGGIADKVRTASDELAYHTKKGLENPSSAEHHLPQAAKAAEVLRTHKLKVAKRSISPKRLAAKAALTAPRDEFKRRQSLGLDNRQSK
jgi:hypothetical protein